MKYYYTYRSSDGVRHESAIDASSRDDAFAALRAQGIKPIKVVAADGSKANGEVVVRGVRKRIVTLVVVGLLSASAIVSLLSFRAGRGLSPSNLPPLATDRHQVYGDPATIQEIESGAIPIATTPIEKFLFAYAIPGRPIPVSMGTDPRRPANFISKFSNSAQLSPSDLQSLALTPLNPSDRPEATAYRQILNGLKLETKSYLDGGGTWRSFVAELNARQTREIEIYERTKRELESDPSPALRDSRNATLRALGLRTIPRPKK